MKPRRPLRPPQREFCKPMMTEKEIKETVEYLQQYPYLNKVERLCEAILWDENTDTNENVLTLARNLRCGT